MGYDGGWLGTASPTRAGLARARREVGRLVLKPPPSVATRAFRKSVLENAITPQRERDTSPQSLFRLNFFSVTSLGPEPSAAMRTALIPFIAKVDGKRRRLKIGGALRTMPSRNERVRS